MREEITVSDKMKICHDNGVKIFPKFNMDFQFAVVIEDEHQKLFSKNPMIGEFKHTNKTINEAILEALDSCYLRLKE